MVILYFLAIRFKWYAIVCSSSSDIDQKDEGTLDDQRRDGGTNFILRIKEQETCLTLQEHDDDDDR